MKRLKLYKNNKNTIKYLLLIVFFLSLINSIILFNIYGNRINNKGIKLIDQKIDKVLYQFFTDLITDDILNNENIGDILIITRNKNEEIVKVDYNLEKTYKVLTDTSNILKKSLSDFENGNIDVKIYDKYLDNGNNGLLFHIPFFIYSDNVFLNNFGPRIPVLINFNETLLTNIKTKVTNYGFNNALLEVYITVEMQKLIITPVVENNKKFNYDILISALVINGRVPEFYGDFFESNSGILDVPIK